MDFITGNIKQLYRKFLIASMASAMVMSIYSFVDTIAVGQSEGPAGAAAMAVITPLYGVLIFLGILCGVGASVLYGVVATISSLFQALYCGVGQAIQPIVSASCGAERHDRIKQVWKMALATVIGLGIAFTAIGELFPEQIVRLFMDVTPEVMEAAPSIIRPYFLLFLCLGITVLATYHLQSTMHGARSMMIAILRSVAISGLLLLVLPLLLGIQGVWLAMPVSEPGVAIITLVYIQKRT